MAVNICVFGLLSLVSLAYGEQSYKATSSEDNKDDSQVYVYPAGFKGGRYYYGGIYRGSCHNDGLYYRDENSFVICSNGNAYVQPCAPGTKSSGQHRYSPGYYYGYSDFCDINLVDQGYGPAHYAPYGVPTNPEGYSHGKDDGYNQKKATSYGTDQGYDSASGYRYGGYEDDKYSSYGSNKDSYGHKSDGYGGKNDVYSKDVYNKAQSYSQQKQQPQQGYGGARDVYGKKETAYEPNAKVKY